MKRGVRIHAEQLIDDDAEDRYLRLAYPDDEDESATTWYVCTRAGFRWLGVVEHNELEWKYQAMKAKEG